MNCSFSVVFAFLVWFRGYVWVLTEYEELKKSLMELAVIIFFALVAILAALIYMSVRIKRLEERIGIEEALFGRFLEENKTVIEALTFIFNGFVLIFSVGFGAPVYRYITYELEIMLFFAYVAISYIFYKAIYGTWKSKGQYHASLRIIAYVPLSLLPFILGFINPSWYSSSALTSASALTAETFYFLNRWREGTIESR